MSNADIVRRYFQEFFTGKTRHSRVRSWLTDDFTFRDPLMSAEGADDYVRQLQAFGDELEVRADVRAVVEEGDTVAALVDVEGPAGKMTYAQWFTLRDGRIAGLEVVYDPRPFLGPA